jgi:hypothetical protein
MEERVREFLVEVDTHGWIVMRIAADGPGPDFAYSIGLVRTYAHPEIIVVGLPMDVAHNIINDLGAAVRDGARFNAGQISGAFLKDYDVTFRAVPEYQYGAYLGWGQQVYGRSDFPVLQLIYPDRAGRWPWQDGVASQFRALQPVLADEPEPPWAREAAV